MSSSSFRSRKFLVVASKDKQQGIASCGLMLPRFCGRFTVSDSGGFLEPPFEVYEWEVSDGRVSSPGIVDALDILELGESGSDFVAKRLRSISSHSKLAKKLSHRALT